MCPGARGAGAGVEVLENTPMKNHKPIMKTIRITLPEALIAELDERIEEGWFPNRDLIFEKALKKFLNSHRPEIMEKHIREDVEWGLRGGK
jgi:Arc/MetJ-type ribon-helix-helix transcriptional regulator